VGKSIVEFQQKSQPRFVQELQLLSANENMKRGDWDEALKILRPLWQKMSFRKEGWWNGVEEISWALRKAALHAGDGGSVIAVDWEMMNRSMSERLPTLLFANRSFQISHIIPIGITILPNRCKAWNQSKQNLRWFCMRKK
jgi:hypothetical protein